jgi:CO/xanthine dehydrogenase Mo-binding subunit
VDRDTGAVTFVRYLEVGDFGTVLNPLPLRRQVQGDIVQGIGQAPSERTECDDEGQLLSGS